jgi:type IX secretion system PorP/SprF family membrane protein
MLKRIVFVAMTISITLTYGQQMPQYSQYLRNQSLVNPAAVGVYDFVDVTMGGRMQWTGVSAAPTTGYLLVNSPLSAKPKPRYNPSLRVSNEIPRNPEIKTGKVKHAVGGQFVSDQYGAFRSLYFSGAYALHLPVSKNTNLSFGTRLGLSNNAFLQNKAQVLSGTVDNTYQMYGANLGSMNIMDISAGLYLYSKKAFIGIAADNLSKDFVRFGSSTANFDRRMHFNAIAGLKIPVTAEWTITPAVLAKMMYTAPLSIEGSLQFEYKEFLWFGTSYRHTDAIVGMFGLNINQRLKLGYAFDYSLSRFNKVSSGGHEVVLGLMIGR